MCTGFSIVLALVMDRVHHYIKQIDQLRRELDVLKKKHDERKGKEIHGKRESTSSSSEEE